MRGPPVKEPEALMPARATPDVEPSSWQMSVALAEGLTGAKVAPDAAAGELGLRMLPDDWRRALVRRSDVDELLPSVPEKRDARCVVLSPVVPTMLRAVFRDAGEVSASVEDTGLSAGADARVAVLVLVSAVGTDCGDAGRTGETVPDFSHGGFSSVGEL